MDQPSNAPEPTARPTRPIEQETVLTTIVGSRPPGSGQPIGHVPRGIEVLVKKAAVDAEFKKLLLDKRAEAAQEIGLQLEPAEALMLGAVPAPQLERIIARTTVPEEHRRAFLGQAAAAMLAALGVILPGCGPTPVREPKPPRVQGIRPDLPPHKDSPPVVTGSRPDLPPPKDWPPAPTGIAPDRPAKKGKAPESKDQGNQGPAPAPDQPPGK